MLIIFELNTRPSKPNRWREKSKNMQKWAFLPQKGAKGGSQSFQSNFNHYHRNQRPKKRWGPLAHQNLTVSLKVSIFELRALYP